MFTVRGPYLLLRSLSLLPSATVATALSLIALGLGPYERTVMLRDGVVGHPMPLVLGLGALATLPLWDHAADRNAESLPRSSRVIRCVRSGAVLTISAIPYIVSASAPWLSSAVIRNLSLGIVALALGGLFDAAPVAGTAWSGYLAASWFFGTPGYGEPAAAWAIPVSPPDPGLAVATFVLALSVLAAYIAIGPLHASGRSRAGKT